MGALSGGLATYCAIQAIRECVAEIAQKREPNEPSAQQCNGETPKANEPASKKVGAGYIPPQRGFFKPPAP